MIETRRLKNVVIFVQIKPISIFFTATHKNWQIKLGLFTMFQMILFNWDFFVRKVKNHPKYQEKGYLQLQGVV